MYKTSTIAHFSDFFIQNNIGNIDIRDQLISGSPLLHKPFIRGKTRRKMGDILGLYLKEGSIIIEVKEKPKNKCGRHVITKAVMITIVTR